jgi:integrase
MASLETTPSGNFHVVFWFQGERYKRALRTKKQRDAELRKARLEDTLRLVECGRIKLPKDIDVPLFLLSDGKLQQSIAEDSTPTAPPPRQTIEATFNSFFASIPEGNLEATTLDGMHRHEKHLLRVFGSAFLLPTLTLDGLQTYVNKRSKSKTHYGSLVSAATIHKELVTLGTVWRWAERLKLVSGSFPRRGVRLPKQDELPPFQTWGEIERQIEQGGLDEAQASVLWDALYLRKSEVDELIAYVKEHGLHAFIYPMVVMAAHTGARRSELMRSQRLDFDLEGSVVTIREKKRVKGRNTTRRVPMSPTLKTAITDWFENEHPGGPHTFCHGVRSSRSRSKAKHASPLSNDQAHAHWERTLKNSKWEKVKGWHCLRHSFISNLASQGIDQRIIDDFVGHTTEQMRRRYRHLIPDVKQAAIDAVFG